MDSVLILKTDISVTTVDEVSPYIYTKKSSLLTDVGKLIQN